MSPPAGWFPDPEKQGQLRYWDGTEWTAHRTPPVISGTTSFRSLLAAIPVIALCAVVGSAAAFILGGLVGLVLGLRAYPPTAWVAVFEVGIPAAFCGAVLGFVVGVIAFGVEKISHR